MSNLEPAFPQPNQMHPGSSDPESGPGMTLLDYFAGQALTVMHIGNPADIPFVAEISYDVAEAMLAERAKRMAAA
jgi:hypothetical protein